MCRAVVISCLDTGHRVKSLRSTTLTLQLCLNIPVLRVQEIYALENVVFSIVVYGAYKP